jgi:hypothetical protein
MAGERVHMEKLDELGEELVKRHLARRVPRSAWYDVEPRIERDFMAYLAGVLGRISDVFGIVTKGYSRKCPNPRGLRYLWHTAGFVSLTLSKRYFILNIVFYL